MMHWRSDGLFLSFLEKHHSECGIACIRQEDSLAKVYRTSVPWTSVPGAVCLALDEKYLNFAARNHNVAGIIIPPHLLPFAGSALKRRAGLVVAEQAEELYFLAHLAELHACVALQKPMVAPYIDSTAKVHPSAVLGRRVHLGRDVEVGPYAVIGENCFLDDGCWLGPHVVLGEDAFFPRKLFGQKVHMPHFGGVKLGKRCRVHAQSIIAASSYFGEFTELKDEVFLGFQTVIGHDAVLGARCEMSSKALVAGRTVLGDDVTVCAAASVSNTLEIGKEAFVVFGAVVIDNVPPKGMVSGNFAVSHYKNLRCKVERQ